MSEKPAYFDLKTDLWKKGWENAKNYEDFLASAPIEHKVRWDESLKRSPDLTIQQKERLKGYNRILRILLVGGTWCMDCSRSGPYIKKIVEECDSKVELRFIDRETLPELRDELRIMGAPRVPSVIFLNEEWFEAGRFSDRTLSIYRSKLAREVGIGIDKGILSLLARETELAEWVDIIERLLIIQRVAPSLRKKYND
ncbi:thioredoxin family protein [Candidatus Bathyarchaeota archaeon]|nr:thioredoxin family protein [Candidatus Bathyarchaeota archaeon]